MNMHLDFSSLYHGAIQVVSCSIGIEAICECNKTETLHAWDKKQEPCIKDPCILHRISYLTIIKNVIKNRLLNFSIYSQNTLLLPSSFESIFTALSCISALLRLTIITKMKLQSDQQFYFMIFSFSIFRTSIVSCILCSGISVGFNLRFFLNIISIEEVTGFDVLSIADL